MKTFLAGLVLACALPLHADILANSNFAAARSDWEGDAKYVDSSNGYSGSPTQGSVTVSLKQDKKTTIYQFFNSQEKRLRYTISFTVSSDYDARPSSPSEELANLVGFKHPLKFMEQMAPSDGSWQLVLFSGGTSAYSSKFVRVDAKQTGMQTLTGTITAQTPQLDPDAKTFMIIFPHGEGTITLTNISLSPAFPGN